MKGTFLLLVALALAGPLQAETRSYYLPPWYRHAALQIHTLELTNVPFAQIKVVPSCAVYLTNTISPVCNGQATATLFIDLKKSPPSFPIFILGPDERGNMTWRWLHLNCHLSLVPDQCELKLQGNRFTVINLTDQPLELERQLNIMDLALTSRQATGTYAAGARLKFLNLTELRLLDPGP